MRTKCLDAPAKLNLALFVLGKRGDGYHELLTLFERLDLCDSLKVGLDPLGPAGVALQCSAPELEGPGNLAYRAAGAFLSAAGIEAQVEIELEKRIPVARGLGGGSSDAAAVLKALNELAGFPLKAEALWNLGAGLGADVPFFLRESPWALGRGRGDEIEALELPWELKHLLVVPAIGHSTPEVYGALDAGVHRDRVPPEFVEALCRKDLEQTLRTAANDLEKSAVISEKGVVPEILKWVRSRGLSQARMSGSGSAVFAVLEKNEKVGAMVEDLESRGLGQAFVVQTQLGS
ncbi:MAG: 4-(cytidine 5'-diphospho)-2-C-methyl-D-erythritol kinase [Candidatus Omnitrophica bacterium]|nr:4-(cytidine 5'-diphospho)-2-C-methyl-D-erythritol kinase [Candidatus Omnitrophota bacterium]